MKEAQRRREQQLNMAKGKRSQSAKSEENKETRRIKNSRIPRDAPKVKIKKTTPKKTPVILKIDLISLHPKTKGSRERSPRKTLTHKTRL